MIAPSTLDKINALPEEVQEQLFLYVDFLFAVYRSDTGEEDAADFLKKFELTDEGKEFLEKRALAALKHPERLKPWHKVLGETSRKYNWPKN